MNLFELYCALLCAHCAKEAIKCFGANIPAIILGPDPLSNPHDAYK